MSYVLDRLLAPGRTAREIRAASIRQGQRAQSETPRARSDGRRPMGTGHHWFQDAADHVGNCLGGREATRGDSHARHRRQVHMEMDLQWVVFQLFCIPRLLCGLDHTSRRQGALAHQGAAQGQVLLAGSSWTIMDSS